MKNFIICLILILLLGELLSQPITQSNYNYKTIESDHFKLHFPEQYLYFSKYFLNLAEEIHNHLNKFYYIENKKTHLVLIFNHDIINAFTTVHGLDTIVFYLSQPPSGSFANFKNWYKQLILHEYTHIITLRYYQGFWNYTFRLLFGVPPNLALANGIIEGIAVIEESYLEKNIGRLFDPNTNSLIRNQLLYNKFPSLEEILGGSYYWPLEDINYLYGARFIETIIQDSQSKELFNNIFYSNKLPIFLNSRFKEKNLKSIDRYYKIFKQNEYQFYYKWLKEKTEKPLTPYKQLTSNGGIKKNLKIFNNNIYYFEKSSYRSPGIYILDKNTKLIYKSININDFFIDKEDIITSEPTYYNGNNLIEYNIFINSKETIEESNQNQRKWYPIKYQNSLIYLEKNDPFLYIVQVDLEKKSFDYFLKHKKILFKTYFLNSIDYLVLFENDLYFILKPNDSLNHFFIKCNLINNECKSVFYSNYVITTMYSDNKSIYFSCNMDNNYEIYQFDVKNNLILQLTNSFLSIKYPIIYNKNLYFIGETYNGFEIYHTPIENLLYYDVSKKFNFKEISLNQFENYAIDQNNNLIVENYKIREFKLYLDGILTNSNSEVAIHLSGYDPLRRHWINFGTGLLENYTLYFFNYHYNQFLPNLNLGFIKTNPFNSDKHCWQFLNPFIRNQICDIRYGFESYFVSFQYTYYYRLLKTNSVLGFSHKKNRNSQSDSSAIYQFNDFSQNSLFLKFNLYYLEYYYYSISPENGFNFEFRIEHFPYLWNYISFKNSLKPFKYHYDYSNISLMSEFFLPWFFKNHVPYFSIFTNFNVGKDYQFKRNRLAIYQLGLSILDSTYGNGNIVGTIEYRFPLLYYSKRILWFLPEWGIHWISLAPFYQMGKSFEKSPYENNRIFYSKGVRATLKLFAFYLPFYLHIIYAKGTEEQISFGFSYDINFHTQLLLHQQHPEYLLPTWHYK
jgi:hypothetical protein